MRSALDPVRHYLITDLPADPEQVEARLLVGEHHDMGALSLDDPRLLRWPDLLSKARDLREQARRVTWEAANPEE